LRSAILKAAGPSEVTKKAVAAKTSQTGLGSFQSFIDLLVTPAMAVVAAQVGLIVGTLYGSNSYLTRLAEHDHSKTTVSELPSSFDDADDAEKESSEVVMNDMCKNLLQLTTADVNNPQEDDFSSTSISSANKNPGFPSWDPRYTIMQNLQQAVQNCEKARTK